MKDCLNHVNEYSIRDERTCGHMQGQHRCCGKELNICLVPQVAAHPKDRTTHLATVNHLLHARDDALQARPAILRRHVLRALHQPIYRLALLVEPPLARRVPIRSSHHVFSELSHELGYKLTELLALSNSIQRRVQVSTDYTFRSVAEAGEEVLVGEAYLGLVRVPIIEQGYDVLGSVRVTGFVVDGCIKDPLEALGAVGAGGVPSAEHSAVDLVRARSGCAGS